MPKIWTLNFDQNQVADLGPLKELRFLSTLAAKDNGIKDLSPLKDLKQLTLVLLQDNQLSDLSTLVEMATADSENDRRFSPFWRLFLKGNPLSDEAKKEQIPKLEELGAKVNLTE